jgi:hypothetical protein
LPSRWLSESSFKHIWVWLLYEKRLVIAISQFFGVNLVTNANDALGFLIVPDATTMQSLNTIKARAGTKLHLALQVAGVVLWYFWLRLVDIPDVAALTFILTVGYFSGPRSAVKTAPALPLVLIKIKVGLIVQHHIIFWIGSLAIGWKSSPIHLALQTKIAIRGWSCGL